MGNYCGCLNRNPIWDVADSSDDIESIMCEDGAVWRHELTLTEARKCFEADGTVPVGCSDEMLELRMYISDPSLLRGMISHSSEASVVGRGNNVVKMLSRWVDIMSFKYVDNCAPELKISAGYSLFFKYFDPNNAGVRRVLCDPKMVSTIERELREAAAFNGKYGQGVTMRTDGAGILRNSLFDEIYFADMETILNTIYLPMKADSKHQELIAKAKSQYNQIHVKDFEYMETLGHGGFGMVVHCKKKSTGVHYAMKIQTKDGAMNNCNGDFARVTIEKDALVLCNHPFITNLLYSFQNEQLIMMVMSLALSSLADFAKECVGGVLTEVYVKFYAAEVLLALNHIHHLGMIYRDMKPGNILLMEDGHVKLADLGGVIAVGNVVSGYHTQAHDGLFGAVDMEVRDAEISSSVLNRSQSGGSGGSVASNPSNSNRSNGSFTEHKGGLGLDHPVVKRYKVADAPTAKDIKRAYTYFGTSGYVAPEVIRTLISGEPQRGYTHAVDFFSLGVTMYRLLTAEFPFQVKTNQIENYARSFDYRPFPRRLVDGSYAASPECRDLLEKLLVGEETKRLGYGRSGCSKIKKHPLFKDISWILLLQKKIVPPVLPALMLQNMQGGGHLAEDGSFKSDRRKFEGFYHMLIASGYTSWVTRSLMTAEEQVHFRSWDFVSGKALSLEIMSMQNRERDSEQDQDPTCSGDWYAACCFPEIRHSYGRKRVHSNSNSHSHSHSHGVDSSTVAPEPISISPPSHSYLQNSIMSLNMGENEADSYIASVHMVDTAASMLRTMEAQAFGNIDDGDEDIDNDIDDDANK